MIYKHQNNSLNNQLNNLSVVCKTFLNLTSKEGTLHEYLKKR